MLNINPRGNFLFCLFVFKDSVVFFIPKLNLNIFGKLKDIQWEKPKPYGMWIGYFKCIIVTLLYVRFPLSRWVRFLQAKQTLQKTMFEGSGNVALTLK